MRKLTRLLKDIIFVYIRNWLLQLVEMVTLENENNRIIRTVNCKSMEED